MILAKINSNSGPWILCYVTDCIKVFQCLVIHKGSILVFDLLNLTLSVGLYQLVIQLQARVFLSASPDKFENVLTPVVRAMKTSRRRKYFCNSLCSSLSLVSKNCGSGIINGWVYRLSKVTKNHPAFLVFISKENSKCN